ncbi:MAG: diphosphate--fructose-6-phosphate 1-phosphotransferase [Dehalococcoidia bacterium]|jgi:6-phosphofructokinase 1|uniref:Phosphofructokinase domain-containing protein n=1 Tax=marine metagenome TaxID=408172 RepID=A0A382AJW8_9ZZZZ|nr:diphosphate--fructose-6-phosphate 1-phosphotransferase [Dehalococcoidia bacterium]MEC7913991.1 diphosphate--fructose-6-phosphate 1-phosphotransferase [Chloroflexota bacterium]HAT22565.1 6-phosphofructokinase [Dehalococcoidia bacterium]HBR64376.1 6-phosphofructokinase [Dehalococcoidia bacterium]|tara:strand:- start:7869 stop:9065 length:1197 start_codon:yes stop_codon:yes gene_type:complete
MATSSGNILLIQSGGCTPVINSTLAGLIENGQTLFPQSRIYGGIHGIEGVIDGKILDITELSNSQLKSLAKMPGAALGSSRHKLLPNNIEPLLKTLRTHNIRILHIIGGNDSAATGLSVSGAARADKYELQVINLPKTIDNDIVLSDHSPGYGSAARFISQATFGVGRDAEAMGINSPICILEVMGRDSGWLAAASSFYKKTDHDAPHFIGIPEVIFSEETFMISIETAYRSYGYAVAVVSEKIRSKKGSLGRENPPIFTDNFGHHYFKSPGQYLSDLVEKKLGVRCRWEKPGTIQRSLIDAVSTTDREEAYEIGQKAIEMARSEMNEVIPTIIRSNNPEYDYSIGSVNLKDVAGKIKYLPEKYRPNEQGYTSDLFKSYLRPLLGNPIHDTEPIFNLL